MSRPIPKRALNALAKIREMADAEGGDVRLLMMKYFPHEWPEEEPPWGRRYVPLSRVADETGRSEEELNAMFASFCIRAMSAEGGIRSTRTAMADPELQQRLSPSGRPPRLGPGCGHRGQPS